LDAFRAQAHPRCVVCAPDHPAGWRIRFAAQPDGSVTGALAAGEMFAGYPDQLHGGIAAALLDGAMTNCLFARGLAAVTAELRVRYLHPITTQSPVTVRAWITESHPPLYLLHAEITQNHGVKTRARGKFMSRPAPAESA
jgi:acyl-coenzyme A thioesterase PaaI-like protein